MGSCLSMRGGLIVVGSSVWVLTCNAVLQRDFTSKFGDVSLQCQPDDLTNRAKVLLKDLCDRCVGARAMDSPAS